ncbi:glycoside hydrolase family 99-like domain-containing protein [Ruegeria sp. HKCCA6837]|uniref:glycoside hydrolase family 99-like domain-containing protein n=1 Tax=Ruegeria sp. HKCCA6837 TaxID=2682989 RepID=UPI001487FD91|nr:glycoside hydrolase family 99-like domain-containing protein [Ruegeria sp. HKCCA6837]
MPHKRLKVSRKWDEALNKNKRRRQQNLPQKQVETSEENGYLQQEAIGSSLKVPSGEIVDPIEQLAKDSFSARKAGLKELGSAMLLFLSKLDWLFSERRRKRFFRSAAKRSVWIKIAHSKLQKNYNIQSTVFKEQAAAVQPGKDFEDLEPTIATGRKIKAKAIAYYLPQFHAIEENDRFWGSGFTEWRNLVRGMPRFEGHIQPRIPRDFGFYDLSSSAVMRSQVRLAQEAGLHGFCFYHYWFDGKRILEAPMECFLEDATLNFPFCLMWANENWTRTWDGHDKEVLLEQTYKEEDDEKFIDDLVRHFRDPRYIHLDGRPLFFIYRVEQIPHAFKRIARWREIFRSEHGINPLLYMAQSFGDLDPRRYGLDGAIEFPPHKLADIPDISKTLNMLDDDFSGRILSYDGMVAEARSEPPSEFPLIRTITPNWDNESRRPGRSTIIHGSSPSKFENWARDTIEYARANKVHGEAIFCVNAWNEWCEGAYLEPDVHFGGAYLNALSRALTSTNPVTKINSMKVLIVGHDALPHGAQSLAIHIGRTMSEQFGISIAFLLGGSGALLPQYQEIGETHVVSMTDSTAVGETLSLLASKGYRYALTNTAVSGGYVQHLKASGFSVLSLIHELPKVLRTYDLASSAEAITANSDLIVFPAHVVRDGFQRFTSTSTKGRTEVLPQGLYKHELLEREDTDDGLRAYLGLAESVRLVIGVGFGDLRKGFDRFVEAAFRLCSAHDDIAFLWLGDVELKMSEWLIPEIEKSCLADRIRIMGYIENIDRYLVGSDVFFLPSREDPFPSVVLEALAVGLPVVGFQGCGGCDDIIKLHGTLVPSDRPDEAEAAILAHLRLSGEAADFAAEARREHVRSHYRFDNYTFALAQRFEQSLARVTVVVPNYNYAQHIPDRLTSIFDQTYPVFETLVLDDASTDESVEVVRSTSRCRGRKVDLILNQENSGSPFQQWQKGATLARGEFLWIAEADDEAAPEFLEKLVANMQKYGADLGFCDSWILNASGERVGESYIPYIGAEEPEGFHRAFAMDGQEFLAKFLSVKNVLLNVSGVLFRRQALIDAMNVLGDELKNYSVAGDWRIYVEMCAAGGKVVWDPQALNGHRRHSQSVTHALKVDKHLSEIAEIHELVKSRVDVSQKSVALQEKFLQDCRDYLSADNSCSV